MHKKKKQGADRQQIEMNKDTRTPGYRASGRLWIEKDGETYLGWGRVILLERIRDHGSISAAARSMGMGYRHAWELVDSMNTHAPAPLVEMRTGGKQGGGATLTAAGEAAVGEFWSLVKDFRTWLNERQIRADRGQ